jgi:hypothetical protein
MLVATPGFEEEEERLEHFLRQYLGEKANIAIDRVNDIPPLCSGKRPYIVNEYLKESLRGAVLKRDTPHFSFQHFSVSAFGFLLSTFAISSLRCGPFGGWYGVC